MYRWRTLTDEQRHAVLKQRRQNSRPWHSPPHIVGETSLYLITAACYEHRPVIGTNPERMLAFQTLLLDVLRQQCQAVFAWIVLPNHYHLLVDTPDIEALLAALGHVHGRTSYEWNGEDSSRGRKVWHNAAETAIKSGRHFWATLNYVLNNAVRHCYAERWTDWPYSNAQEYLATLGRDEALRIWREYPVMNYGDDWDPPEM